MILFHFNDATSCCRPAVATGQGVTAWLGRPVQRERPNEQFLQRTLRSVQAHNQRAQEEEMWERHLQRRQREEEKQPQLGKRGGHGSSSPSRSRPGELERSLDRSESPSRSRSRSRSAGGRPRRVHGPGREHSRDSRGSSDAAGRPATNRKRRHSQSPSGDREWHSADRDGQDVEAAPGPVPGSPSGHASDDAIAAMIASKRSRCAEGLHV